MAWPKGKPRKPLEQITETAPAMAEEARTEVANATPKKRPLMKARPNWDDVSDLPDDPIDRFHIPNELFPSGYDFQWVTVKVMGADTPEISAQFERRGWTQVYGQDFDGIFDGKFLAKGSDDPVIVDGLALMVRPLELTIKARKEERARAQRAVMIKQQQLTGGDLPGVSLDSRHPSAVNSNRINRTIEPISIPQDGDN